MHRLPGAPVSQATWVWGRLVGQVIGQVVGNVAMSSCAGAFFASGTITEVHHSCFHQQSSTTSTSVRPRSTPFAPRARWQSPPIECSSAEDLPPESLTHPSVRAASAARSTSPPRGVLRVWTLKISCRAAASGGGTSSSRSKRPGLSRAGSTLSGLLVAASTTTPRRACRGDTE